MKKNIKLFVGAVLTLFLCWFIGQQLKQARSDAAENLREEKAWDLFDHMNSDQTIFYGSAESTDYPFGFNIGLIEDEDVGLSILLTPGTGLTTVCPAVEKAFLELSFQIHPWVSESSDGALLHITIASDTVGQEYVYATDSDIQTQTIALDQFGTSDLHFELTVSNEEEKNEICDWVIIRQFTLCIEK